MTTAPVLHAQDVELLRDGSAILSYVSLTVRTGEHRALLGPDGAGRTTLLALLGALARPTRGTVEVLGHRLADLADAAGDLRELSELLDEGSMHAGLLLTRRAAATGDLRELQRISDAGYDEADNELDRLLQAPNGGYRG